MDLISVLEKFLGADVIESEKAQAALDENADYNLEDLLVSLCKILADTEKCIPIRRAAAIQIKLAIKTGDELSTRLDYQTRWFSLEPTVRRLIKDTVLGCLGTEKITPSPAAELLAFIAAAELPNDHWPDLFSDLTHNVTSTTNSDMIKEASLVAISRLCRQNYESESCKQMLEKSSEIFKSIFHGLLYTKNNDVITAAIGALREWIRLKKEKFCADPQVKSAVQRVFELVQSSDNRIKIASLKCLRKFQLSYTDKQLCKIMIEAVKSELQDIRLQGFKFWYEQCFEDAVGVQTQIQQILIAKFTNETLPILLPVLMEALTIYGHEEKEGKLWVLASNSVRVLSEWCDVTTLRDYLTLYVQQHVSNEDWRYRCSAIRAYYALLWTKMDAVDSLISKAFPVLVDLLEKDKNPKVRCVTAAVIGGVCSKIQTSKLLRLHLNIVVEGLLKGLKDEPNVVCGACEALEDLAYKAYSFSEKKQTFCLSPYFQFIVYTLLDTLYRRDGTKASRCSIYDSLKCLLQYCTKDCYFTFTKLATVLGQRLQGVQAQVPQQSGDTHQCEVTYDTETVALLRTLQTLIRIMAPEDLTTSYGNILTGLIQLLKRQRCQLIVRASTLETITLIIKGLGDVFLPHVESVMPLILVDLKNRRKDQICIAAVQLVHATCNAIGDNFLLFCEPIFPILLENLNNESASDRIKDSILFTIGDIARAIGPHFKKFSDTTLTTVVLAQTRLDNDYLLDDRIYSLHSHHGYFLNAYTGIISGLKDDKESVSFIIKFLEPQLSSMIKVITLMALNKSNSAQMDDFYFSQAITFLKNICTIFGKNIQHLVDNSSVLKILKTGCSSEKEETKKLSRAIIDKLNQLNMITIKTQA